MATWGQRELLEFCNFQHGSRYKKVQVGKDQEKAQSEKDSHSKNRGGEKNKLTIRHLYNETYSKQMLEK